MNKFLIFALTLLLMASAMLLMMKKGNRLSDTSQGPSADWVKGRCLTHAPDNYIYKFNDTTSEIIQWDLWKQQWTNTQLTYQISKDNTFFTVTSQDVSTDYSYYQTTDVTNLHFGYVDWVKSDADFYRWYRTDNKAINCTL